MSEYSKNARAEAIVGRRLRPEDEERGVTAIDQPCELGYRCPACKRDWDEDLLWSEYAGFMWCSKCNFDWPSALCVNLDAKPDPEHPWVHAGRENAVKVYLDTIEDALRRKEPKP